VSNDSTRAPRAPKGTNVPRAWPSRFSSTGAYPGWQE
jgi:hypothetical protein